ncbi:MAG: Ppx/GppA phosphatase family protein [Oligoflexia bacterium]
MFRQKSNKLWPLAALFLGTAVGAGWLSRQEWRLWRRPGSNCITTRAALDLGSSSFKLKVARVDTCLQKIEAILLDRSEKTGFKDATQATAAGAAKNKAGSQIPVETPLEIPKETLALGKRVVESLISEARQKGATEFYAVGTQIFREAKNSAQFFASLPKVLQARIVSNLEEAILGYAAATLTLGESGREVVVWDIGGGSMQMIRRKGPSDYDVYLGTFASIAGREMTLQMQRDAKGTQASKGSSPNPVGLPIARKVLDQVSQRAQQELSSFSQALLPDSLSRLRVLGLGGVHYSSVLTQVRQVLGTEQNSYTPEDLDATFQVQAQKSDEQLNSKYANSQVSNLLLVRGFMKASGISRVEVVDANLADALLISGLALLNER